MDAERLVLNLPLPPTHTDRPSIYLFSLARAGSRLFFALARKLAEANGYAYVDLNRVSMHDMGYLPRQFVYHPDCFQPSGYCYGGFRFWPERIGLPDISAHKKFLFIRDPRDMAVSAYYAYAFSHPPPRQGESDAYFKHFQELKERILTLGLDGYGIEVSDFYARALREYAPLLEDSNCRVLRYEDAIENRAAWVDLLADWFGLTIEPEDKPSFLHDDLLPSHESLEGSRRQGETGQYHEFTPDALKRIEDILGEELPRWGYARSTSP